MAIDGSGECASQIQSRFSASGTYFCLHRGFAWCVARVLVQTCVYSTGLIHVTNGDVILAGWVHENGGAEGRRSIAWEWFDVCHHPSSVPRIWAIKAKKKRGDSPPPVPAFLLVGVMHGCAARTLFIA